jgi:hypothetical protein
VTKIHFADALLDITNRAKQHRNLISATPQVQRIYKYKERLQLLCVDDELCVPAWVGPDEMGEVVDDIGTMLDWYLLTVQYGYCFSVPAFMSESLSIFFATMM